MIDASAGEIYRRMSYRASHAPRPIPPIRFPFRSLTVNSVDRTDPLLLPLPPSPILDADLPISNYRSYVYHFSREDSTRLFERFLGIEVGIVGSRERWGNIGD